MNNLGQYLTIPFCNFPTIPKDPGCLSRLKVLEAHILTIIMLKCLVT